MNLYTNLNLPEPILKLLEEKGAIKCLADGKIAVENDNLDALRKVLKAAFPNCDAVSGGIAIYYLKDRGNGWLASNLIDRPSIPASILAKELEEKPFEWGERVWVSNNTVLWREALFLSNSPRGCFEVLLKHGTTPSDYWKFCQREKPKPAPLRITPDMIREKFNCEEFELVNEKA